MRKKSVFVITAYMVVIILSAYVVVNISPHEVFAESTMVHMERGYQPHDLIEINGDGDFTNSDAVVSGNGTKDDPYIIENWEIDAKGADAAIYIGNTSSYVIIRNCHVFNATDSTGFARGSGIALYSAQHVQVENVTSERNPNGIWTSTYSEYINISNSTLVENGVGILLHFRASHVEIFQDNIEGKFTGIRMDHGVNNITAEKNGIYNVTDYGIEMLGSLERISNVTLESNTIRWAGIGIYMLSENDHHRIIGNIISNSSSDGIYAKDNVHDNVIEGNRILSSGNYGIDADNSDSGDGGFNHNVIRNNEISQSSGHGFMMNGRYGGCSYNTISGNRVIYSAGSGIYLYFATNNRIDNNSIEYSHEFGLRIYGPSDNNVIDGNMIAHTTYHAVYMLSATGNIIYNNSFYYNNGTGDSYNPSNSQAYDSSGNNVWCHNGKGNYWHDLAGSYEDGDGDGILDGVSYPLDGGQNVQDNYPLANPGVEIPEIHLIAVMLIPLAILGIAMRKIRK